MRGFWNIALVATLLLLASTVTIPSTRAATWSGAELPSPGIAAPLTVASPQHTSPPGRSAGAATEQRILSALHDSHVPLRYAYLPNFHAVSSRVDRVVTPTYLHSPAPYGIASYGVENASGNATGYILNSSSYEGAITFNSLDEFYLDNDATDYIGAQLNSVVSNITLFGQTNYSFWNQNVITYSARTNLLQFIDNIWNFSSPAFYLSPNVFNATGPNGTLIAPAFYYGLGPVLNVSMPFTVDLYLNATTTNVNGFPDDIVYFNYTVIKSGVALAAGTFDWAIFNSQDPANPIATLPAPVYQINGLAESPTGYLPYESELVFCGPGGGSTTTVLGINATLNLWYLASSTGTYQTVPSAYSYGTNTGETIEGATEWFDASNTVHVGPGPTLPFPLWNGSAMASPGRLTIQGTVAPDTSFVFLNESASFNSSWAAWAPVPIGGGVSYAMPVGDYVGEVLMANHDPAALSIRAGVPASWGLNVSLSSDPATGIYTPLIAFDDSQLAELAVSGSGSPADPYRLPSNAVASLDPIFGSLNIFGFPVFPGLLLAHTTAYVVANDSSTFHIDYAGGGLTEPALSGLPKANALQFELYGTSHVSIVNTTGISGWFDGGTLAGFPLASMMVWNSSSTLIASDLFSSQGTTLLLYGGTGNTVWGNRFTMDPSLSDPAIANVVLAGTFALGPQVYESGDLLFGNAFLTQIPAYSPAATIYYETFYSSFNGTWTDSWNVSAGPASGVHIVNGIPLSGSIVNGSDEGGNLWWDYVPGTSSVPYNDAGRIAIGGDGHPMIGDLVSFVESGLAPSTFWGFTFAGLSAATSSPIVVISFYDGSFPFEVLPVPGYRLSGGQGVLVLAGGPGGIAVNFSPSSGRYTLAFSESGLPTATSWTVSVNGVAHASATSTLVLNEDNGTFTWVVSPVVGLVVRPSAGTTTIQGANQSVSLTFGLPTTESFRVAFFQLGLADGTLWTVTLDGTTIASQFDTIDFSEPNGSYAYTIGNVSGYSVTPTSGTVTVAGGTSDFAVTFTAILVPLAGTVTPAFAFVWIDGGLVTVSPTGAFSVDVVPGFHAVAAQADGYYPFFEYVNVSVDHTIGTIDLAHVPVAGTGTSSVLLGPDLALLAGVATLALIFLIAMAYFWSRSRRPPDARPRSSAGPPGP